MATFTVQITRNWQPHPKAPPLIDIGTFNNEQAAKTFLESELRKQYGEFRIEHGQYLHMRSQAGDQVLGQVRSSYTEQERRDRRITELRNKIAPLQAELDQLLQESGDAEKRLD